MIDIVIPLGIGSKDDNMEIRLALRSAERFVQELGNVFIVGHKPKWMQNVIHIPANDTYTSNKDANLITKVYLACMRPELSEDFIRMSDDQGFLKPITLQDLTVYHYGQMNGKGFATRHKKWMRRMENTRLVLIKNKRPTFQYDFHMPSLYNKNLFMQVYKMRNDYWKGIGYCINTMYYNSIDIPRIFTPTVLKADFGRCYRMHVNDFNNQIRGRTFYGFNDLGYKAVKQHLLNYFNVKSKYEK